MAEIVGSALVQEGVSRAVSFVLGEREEKASEGLSAERLEMAVSELEFALERTAKLPVTEVSLLHRRKMIKRAYLEGTELLNKHRLQALQGKGSEIGQGLKRKGWIIRAKNPSTSSFAGLKTDDVQRFEWYADCAGKFVRDVESGCSLRHYTFCNPHVRHLLQGKTLRYEMLQGSRLRRFFMSPMCSEERGVETVLEYNYMDCKMPEKSFNIALFLRLSESTDIVGTVIICLQVIASQLKLVTETAMEELTLLANLQYIFHSHAPPWAYIHHEPQHPLGSHVWRRPDPVCCRENGHGACVSNTALSELLHMFPEQVSSFGIQCSVSALDCSLPSSSDEAGKRRVTRDWRPPLELVIACLPHYRHEEQQRPDTNEFEIIGDNEERRDVSIQQGAEMLRSKATNFFLRQPELTESKLAWLSKHGCVAFLLEKPSTHRACGPKTSGRSRPEKVQKRRAMNHNNVMLDA